VAAAAGFGSACPRALPSAASAFDVGAAGRRTSARRKAREARFRASGRVVVAWAASLYVRLTSVLRVRGPIRTSAAESDGIDEWPGGLAVSVRAGRRCGSRAYSAPGGQSRERAAEGDGIDGRAGCAGESRGLAIVVPVRRVLAAGAPWRRERAWRRRDAAAQRASAGARRQSRRSAASDSHEKPAHKCRGARAYGTPVGPNVRARWESVMESAAGPADAVGFGGPDRGRLRRRERVRRRLGAACRRASMPRKTPEANVSARDRMSSPAASPDGGAREPTARPRANPAIARSREWRAEAEDKEELGSSCRHL